MESPPNLNFHSALLQNLADLLTENDEQVHIAVALLSQPLPIRQTVQALLRYRHWAGVSMHQCLTPGNGGPFHVIGLRGNMEGTPVSVSISGDPTDVQSAANPTATAGRLFISCPAPDAVAGLIEKLLVQGFRFHSGNQRRSRPTWHDVQMGRATTVVPAPATSHERGAVQLILGRDDDHALQLQLKWGTAARTNE